ncbi:MAG: toll/interleukin-1 receptor domain-containing protein, partial [Planctomycetota bacterium JB042]
MRPRIFISHSAKEEGAGAFLDGLAAALEGEGFDVLLDRERLHAGDDWFGCISNWVEYCHGAIVLFSPAALRSEFVSFEV